MLCPLLWLGRDMVWFTALLLAGPAVLPTMAGLIVAIPFTRSTHHRAHLAHAAVGIILACVMSFLVGFEFRDPLGLAVWKTSHTNRIAEATSRFGVIARWDAGGWSGSAGDWYIVSDPDDALPAVDDTDRWFHRSECPPFNARRFGDKLYLVTTFDCPLDE